MVSVSIGALGVPRDQATPGWVTEQLIRRNEDGKAVCVRVRIDTDDVRLTLVTRACPASAGVEGQLNRRERHIRDLWIDRVYQHDRVVPGNLLSFLLQLDSLL